MRRCKEPSGSQFGAKVLTGRLASVARNKVVNLAQAAPVDRAIIEDGNTYSAVHEPGAAIAAQVIHPDTTIFERLYRKLPEESWFSPLLTPRSPVIFEIGAYRVPKDMELWIFDYEFSVFRPSGINPGDSVMAEDWHYSGFMGFDLLVGLDHQTNAKFELDPTATTLQRDTFRQDPNYAPTAIDFNRSMTNSFAATTSSSTSLLPVRNTTMGPRGGPFTIVVTESRVVSITCVIFQQVTGVVNWIQGDLSGYLLKKNTSTSLLEGVRPR
jgi:hypothetical protein